MSSMEMPVNSSVDEEDEACVYALQLAGSRMILLVLNTAVELQLFDIIAEAGPVAASQIASKLPTQNPDAACRLERILDLLASYSLLSFSLQSQEDGRVERLYGLAPPAKFFLKNQGDGSLASFLQLIHHPANRDHWSHMAGTILGGGNLYERAYGMTSYQFKKQNPSLNEAFNKAMADRSAMFMKRILQKYQGFEGLTSLVDVGGGNGAALNMIILKYPSIKGINLDLPQVVKDAPLYPDVEHVGGDMFVHIPKGDSIMMNRVCHNWSDEHCLKILRNCNEALPEKGKVIVMEYVRSTAPEPTPAGKFIAGIDTAMFIHPGGRERTQREFEALCKASGFCDFRVVCSVYTVMLVMEFCK